MARAPVISSGFDYNARMFVADQDTSGRMCIASPNAALKVGSPVTVIFPGFPQYFVVGRLGPRRRLPCFHAAAPPLDTMEYVVEAPADTMGRSGVPIVIVGSIAVPTVHADTVSIELEPGQPPTRFRYCASSEGLHATAWAGVPLVSPRRWHVYYYLGYDVDPNCEPADYVEDRKPG